MNLGALGIPRQSRRGLFRNCSSIGYARRVSRKAIRTQALTIGASVVPFGIAFGVACAEAGMTWWQALGFSALVFGGSSQFAAVGVIAGGGSVAAAIAGGALLNLRSLAFGILLSPTLTGPRWWRAVVSQLMIDESTAVALSQTEPELRRYGYLAGGISVFVLWNTATLLGLAAAGSLGDLVYRLGLDATIPAAFLALLWPRLADQIQRRVAAIGVAIAILLTPIAPPGIPIIASVAAVLASGRRAR